MPLLNKARIATDTKVQPELGKDFTNSQSPQAAQPTPAKSATDESRNDFDFSLGGFGGSTGGCSL